MRQPARSSWRLSGTGTGIGPKSVCKPNSIGDSFYSMTELISTFVGPLNVHGIRYVVTGSVAAMAYGEPRLTNDIDLILEIRPADIPSLVKAFPESLYYLPPSRSSRPSRRAACGVTSISFTSRPCSRQTST